MSLLSGAKDIKRGFPEWPETNDGQQKFTQISLPVLAIFNVPHSTVFRRTMEDQVNAFENKLPQAQIIRIENADHYLFQSKDTDVVHVINAFVASLSNKDQ